MIDFLTGVGALWVMTGLCVVQTIAFVAVGKYAQAAIMIGYAIADLGVIWGMS